MASENWYSDIHATPKYDSWSNYFASFFCCNSRK